MSVSRQVGLSVAHPQEPVQWLLLEFLFFKINLQPLKGFLPYEMRVDESCSTSHNKVDPLDGILSLSLGFWPIPDLNLAVSIALTECIEAESYSSCVLTL